MLLYPFIKTLLRALWIPEKKMTLIALLFGNMVFAALSLLEPVFFREIIDTLLGFEGQQDPSLDPLFFLLALWIFLGIILIAIRAAISLSSDRLSHSQLLSSKQEFFCHVLSLSFGFHSSTHSGKVFKKFTRGSESLFWVRLDFYRNTFGNILLIVFLVPMVLFFSPAMGSVLLGFVFLFLLIAFPVVRYTSKMQENVEDLYTRESAHVGDVFSNISVVKSFTRILKESHTLKKIHHDLRAKQFPILYWWAFLTTLSRMATTIVFLSIFTFGSFLYLKGVVTIGEIVMFTGLAAILLSSLEQLLWQVDALFWRYQPLKEYYEILDTKPEIQDAPNAQKMPPVTGKIQFSSVFFSHDRGKDVLKDFCFTAQSGQVVALVGHTGAGKSTVANLLCRFFDVQKGKITIDEIDIRSVTQDSLRQQIGMVFQENLLFHASILENIKVGDPNATEAKVIEAAKKAHAWEFIERLPKKLHTIVGERGVKLSGGERQRIAIARVILKNPPIIILDEATSALDAVTEKKLQDALEKLMEGRTTIVIAHRLSTIRKADKILVLEKGKIVESGDYTSLIQKGGAFAELVKAQTEGFVKN
jgi:glucan exporter ATP-binding protein